MKEQNSFGEGEHIPEGKDCLSNRDSSDVEEQRHLPRCVGWGFLPFRVLEGWEGISKHRSERPKNTKRDKT